MAENFDSKGPWTPLKILQWAVPYLKQRGLPNPKFDVECLLAHVLKMDRLKVYLQFDRPLESAELSLLRELLKRRARHEPLQYITGQREFFGLSFKVSPDCLIPRPETEQLVELAIEYLKRVPDQSRKVLDLGTGSGCIAISVAKNIFCKVWAVDIEEKCLLRAQENAQRLGVEGVEWRKGDWLLALNQEDPAQFDLILCNPPYVSSVERAQLDPEVRDFEPPQALFAGESGLEAYEKLSQNLGDKLLPGGIALLELHAERFHQICELFQDPHLGQTLYQDLQGLPRVLELKKISIR